MRSLFHDFQAKIDVLQTSKELLDPREAEPNRLKDEIEYKNTRWASQDLAMENDKKVTEDTIF
jgi:hypothetical protein